MFGFAMNETGKKKKGGGGVLLLHKKRLIAASLKTTQFKTSLLVHSIIRVRSILVYN